MSWPAPVFVELDLAGVGTVMGMPLAGIVGYQVFQRSVVDLDVSRPSVALHDPARYRLRSGQWSELVVDANLPNVRGRFEGERQGWFRLDTGSTNTVTFHGPAVVQMKLLEGRRTTLSFEGGVGGLRSSRSGTLGWFELGGHRFENPRVTFSAADTGALADEYTLGNLGQGFLKPFRVVLDYPGQRIAFIEKRAAPPSAGSP